MNLKLNSTVENPYIVNVHKSSEVALNSRQLAQKPPEQISFWVNGNDVLARRKKIMM